MPHLRPALLPLRFLLPAALALTFTVLSACSGQGEGQLCSQNAGNQGSDDCQSGLVCVVAPAKYMNACGSGANAVASCASLGRCCPPNANNATTAVCSANSGALVDANPAPPDASSEQPPPPDAGADAPDESTAEGATAGDGSNGGAE